MVGVSTITHSRDGKPHGTARIIGPRAKLGVQLASMRCGGDYLGTSRIPRNGKRIASVTVFVGEVPALCPHQPIAQICSGGVPMKAKLFFGILATCAVVLLSSCSGKSNNVCLESCGPGAATLSLTISDTPPAKTSIVSFTLPVIGITLTSSAGQTPVSSTTQNFELTRLQSDTNLIATTLGVTAGTYTAINVTVSAPSAVFANSSSSTVGTCVAGAYCTLTGNPGTITYTFPANSPLILTANSKQWLNLDFNYNNAIVTTNGIGIDITQTGVLTASTTVPTGVSSGNVANIDDFTGGVTAISASSITLVSSVRGTLIATIGSSTQIFDPQSQCTQAGGNLLPCIKLGSIVSLQGVLSNTGVATATSLDVIDQSATPADEVEGILYPSNCNGGSNYGMILGDSEIFTSGSPLTSANFGAGICLTLNQATTFAIDTGVLTGQSGVPTTVGFAGTGDILAGQTVRAKVTSATGTSPVNATATELILRFSRITGTVASSGTTFTVNGLPAYLGNFNGAPQVATHTNATIFEGVTDPNSLTVGSTVSINALYLKAAPTFQAAKVRVP